MNLVDVVVIGIAVLAILRGWRRGLLGQVFELGGGFLGLVAGIVFGPRIARYFTDQPGLRGVLISLLVVFVCLSVGQTIGFMVGHRFGRATHQVGLKGVDSGLGSAFGLLVWILAFWLVGSLLTRGPSPELARALQRSATLRITHDLLPEPPDVLAHLQQYLDTSGFPQVFAGLPRTTNPVDLPSQREARQAIRAAQNATVRVVVPACGGTQLGSGWISSPNTVVTNAHVVAGGSEIRIQQPAGPETVGRVVVFDPEIDVAVVHVQGLTAGPLQLQQSIQERGTPGATLGYPGHLNGQFRGNRAAVQATYQATGRDIYGRGLVNRQVYELRSPVRQGDSGGPFVLPDGQVAGVVFAASTTDRSTGYALTGEQVSQQVQRGAGRTEPADTGPCTR